MAIVLAAMSPAQADKLTLNDILGEWCGEVWNLTFAREQLTITYRDARLPQVQKIRRYVFAEEWVNVIYRQGGNSVFAEFSADGRTMAEQPATLGGTTPRREFRRC